MNKISTGTSSNSASEHRCHCGHLLAKLTHDGVEIKCRRCKQMNFIPWPQVGCA